MNLNYNLKKIAFFCFLICLAVSSVISCASIPTEETVSPNLTPTEINQKAQEELDNGRVRAALAYYQILIGRYGQDMSIRTGAEYEIAHIYVKQKKWLEADDMLKTIISRYETSGGASLSPKYYVLAKNDYARTQEYINKKKLRKKAPDTGSAEKIKDAVSDTAPQLPQNNDEKAVQEQPKEADSVRTDAETSNN